MCVCVCVCVYIYIYIYIYIYMSLILIEIIHYEFISPAINWFIRLYLNRNRILFNCYHQGIPFTLCKVFKEL